MHEFSVKIIKINAALALDELDVNFHIMIFIHLKLLINQLFLCNV